jgi:hypothetical protein
MNAEKVVYALLQADGTLQASLQGRIHGGLVELGSPLPAAVYNVISEVDVQRPLKLGTTIARRARIQVTVHGTDLAEVKRILREVRLACIDRRGAIAGVDVLDVHCPLVGPELRFPDPDRWGQSIDVMVTFNEPNQ